MFHFNILLKLNLNSTVINEWNDKAMIMLHADIFSAKLETLHYRARSFGNVCLSHFGKI